MKNEPEYWENRYKTNNTGWDLGQVSPPLKAYFDQVPEHERNGRILIPGAGYGHEAVYLWQNGFTNVVVLDVSETAFAKLKQKHPDFPEEWLCIQDFFDHKGNYDLIMEQTFFCALDPGLRSAYAKKMNALLNTGGKLVGLLFNRTFDPCGPPFGAVPAGRQGSLNEYKKLFAPYFKIHTLQRCYNSIKPRQGSELFFIFEQPYKS